jgi:hypothetical protein
MYVGVVFFAAAIYEVLRSMTGSTAWAWLSLEDVFDALSVAIFRVPDDSALSLPMALIAVAVLAAASLFILDRRVRAVDVVT